jgi:hypothetical protein
MRSTLVAITFALALLPLQAHADCRERPIFSPPHGTPLPPYPTILVTLPAPTYRELRVQTPHSTTKVGSSKDFETLRVDLYAARGIAEIAVSGLPRRVFFNRYELGVAMPNFVEVSGVTRGSEDTIDFTLRGNAIGLRFAFDDAHTTIVATQQIDLETQLAQIGRVPCFGWNVEQDRLAGGRAFTLFAMFSDGSEQRVGVSRMQLDVDTPALEMPTDLVGIERGRPTQLVTQLASSSLAPPARIIEQTPSWPIALVGALGAIVILVGVGHLRRRRDHESHYTRDGAR